MSENNMPGLEKFLNKIEKLGHSLTSPKVTQRLARKCREIVWRRVKSGKGVNADNKEADATSSEKLAPLSKSYIEYRRGVSFFRTLKNGKVVRFGNEQTGFNTERTGFSGKINKKGGYSKGARSKIRFTKAFRFQKPSLGEFGRPAKSNLTLTGAMLDSITLEYDDGGFRLYIPNSMRPDGKTNAQVAKYVSNGGSYTNGNGKKVTIPARPFFALTKGELRILTRELDGIIKEIIQKELR